MIPKKIFAIWLNHQGIPPFIKKCLYSQELMAGTFGYDYKLLDLNWVRNSCDSTYLSRCIDSEKWAKAADYLRMVVLNLEGGIYLDADVEMIPQKNFDDMLDFKLFCGREENNYVSNAVVGSVPDHPLVTEYLRKVRDNFIPEGDMVFEPGMYLWTELIWQGVNQGKFGEGIKVLGPEYFFPYNHHSKELNVTDASRCVHYFSNSWKTNS